MDKRVELPLIEPLYSTYHYQGPGTAIIANNPSIKNWYLNNVMNLTCSRKFLNGFTTPQITIVKSFWSVNPYLEKELITEQFVDEGVESTIKEMLDNGYYISFCGVDDYYIKGKSRYKERHISHDGLICGYDQEEKTYCIYAYDKNWIYQKFWTPQQGFYTGRASIENTGIFGKIYGLKAKGEIVEFSPITAYTKIQEYLDSNLEKYPFEGEGSVYGIVVHEYIAEYIAKLFKGDIPYERMDRRIFRLIWEHKRVMLERITMIECRLNMDNEISEKYKRLVHEADTVRMLYASHHLKRRDSVLPIIQKNLMSIMKKETELLSMLIKKMEREFEYETVAISQE